MVEERAVFKKKAKKRILFFALAVACFLFTCFGNPVQSAQFIAKVESNVAQSSVSNPSQLLEQGAEYYEASQFAQAATVWEQATSSFAAQGDSLNQAMVLSNLSLTYQQLGQWQEAKAALAKSLDLLQTELATGTDTTQQRVLAQALNAQGRLQLALGQAEQALTTWQQAATTYEQANDRTGMLKSRINQAQALKALGLYRRALTILIGVNKILQEQPDSLIKTAGLRSLGNAFLLVGDLDQSRQVLQQSLALAQKLQSAPDIAATLFDLGNTARVGKDLKAAVEFYQQAAAIASGTQESAIALSPTLKVQAQLNQLSVLIETQQGSAVGALLPKIQSQLSNLPPSRTKVYAQIDLAINLIKMWRGREGDGVTSNSQFPIPNSQFPIPNPSEIAQLLATAVQQAQSLGDQRAEAYALGNLGRLYEQTQQWSIAQELTQKALMLSQAINAPDIAYSWQWQLGRLLKAQGKTKIALAAYTEAVNTLQVLRNDLVAVSPDVQFSFRESVEPIYRQLVSLLLEGEVSQENLAKARDVIESLRIAELNNFFREACLDTKPVQIDQVDNRAAVFYPIILSDSLGDSYASRLEVILSLPQQPLRHYTTPIAQSQLESTIEQLRQTLVNRTKRDYVGYSQTVYDWLIRPAETDLANSKVDTLVFTLDGSLRNIPMAALHDGSQYLVEKYNIALSPSLQLVDPKPFPQGALKTLVAGLTQARLGFIPLNYVAQEVEEIQSKLPSVVLLNQEFTSNAFRKELESSSLSVVHIATHGRFSSNAEETFILAWDRKIHVKEFDEILQPTNPSRPKIIDLLVLSACETAAGDNRAALGLAGVAVRTGARSTLATLWSVSDLATAKLMGLFYEELTGTKVTKAEALRHAQVHLLLDPQYKHPIYWAPFVLVGNWL